MQPNRCFLKLPKGLSTDSSTELPLWQHYKWHHFSSKINAFTGTTRGKKMSIMIKNNLFIFKCMSQVREENSAVFLADLHFSISTWSQKHLWVFTDLLLCEDVYNRGITINVKMQCWDPRGNILKNCGTRSSSHLLHSQSSNSLPKSL